jgi:energy-coupling factor transporter ATP-binding protein EcfA2/energy-coupling factor transporter transmembrane protein EcfT
MDDSPVLRLGRFSYAFPGGTDFTLREICLDVYPGQCHCLTGPTGCGKTTLLMAVRGLLPPGRQSGTLNVRNGSPADGPGSAAAGIVLQNPLTQLVSAELGAEVAFGLENHCVPPARMPAKVHRALADVGLDHPGETPVAALSMGQQYRACLAGTLVMGPSIIMLDEPGAQLDPTGLHRLAKIIAHLKSIGKAVLVCEHRPGFLTEVMDYYWQFTPDGRLQAGLKGQGAILQFADRAHPASTTARTEDPRWAKTGNTGGTFCQNSKTDAVRVKNLLLPGHDNEAPRRLLNFSVARGEWVAVCGPNGAGKTTLVNYLTGVLQPPRGSIAIFGATPAPGKLRGTLGVLFQNPRRQLFATTVFEEVAFAARRRHPDKSSRDVSETVRMLLERLDLGSLGERSPHVLSYGQKHLVSLATVLAGEPRILILDDPLAGLDRDKARMVLNLLIQLCAKNGTTVLCTGHHEDPWSDWANRIIRLAPCPARAATDASFAPFGVASGNKDTYWSPPTGMALIISIGLSMAAFAARTPPLLAILTGINVLLLLVRCAKPGALLRRSAKFFIWQAAIITLFYGLRFGWQSGLAPGLCVAWQLFLAYWPGMIFIASNPTSRVTRALARVLPHQTAFVVSACLRFLPLLLGEMNAIRQAQIFRGARLSGEDLNQPRYWPDWLHCLLVPTLVRALSLASDIALAAMARDFGIYRKRTHWPGDIR